VTPVYNILSCRYWSLTATKVRQGGAIASEVYALDLKPKRPEHSTFVGGLKRPLCCACDQGSWPPCFALPRLENLKSQKAPSRTLPKPPPIMSSLPWNYIAKLVCIGDSGCGKSSLTIRLCEGRFSPHHDVTIGVEFGSRIVPVGPPHSKTSKYLPSSRSADTPSSISRPVAGNSKGAAAEEEQKHMKLSLWDTAGQEQ